LLFSIHPASSAPVAHAASAGKLRLIASIDASPSTACGSQRAAAPRTGEVYCEINNLSNAALSADERATAPTGEQLPLIH
jgi:hypothetical protein